MRLFCGSSITIADLDDLFTQATINSFDIMIQCKSYTVVYRADVLPLSQPTVSEYCSQLYKQAKSASAPALSEILE